jgi:hypothetical protein
MDFKKCIFIHEIPEKFSSRLKNSNRNARSTSTNTVLEQKKSKEAWLPQMGLEHPVICQGGSNGINRRIVYGF